MSEILEKQLIEAIEFLRMLKAEASALAIKQATVTAYDKITRSRLIGKIMAHEIAID